MSQNVAILGASTKPERYAYKAFKMLQEYGHTPFPVTPKNKEIECIKVYPTLAELPSPIDTLTMYVGPQISSRFQDQILELKPKRVIFNPGSENPDLEKALEDAGIHTVEACTLVLLRTRQFDRA
jgi:predicted CoA-binding protein